ncbi:methyltransferase domain-containing protein [Roseiconus lacunae]|uniref:methyltransferase domain-containing protein n=1 Tax=Roseiconus lacunae TaxID=2605694 RepID=UPI0011F221FD|nr:methyltransferase domain-containing protein [Roseiconus lacunae]
MLRQRRLVPELMDDPGLDVDRHHTALAGLRRINYFSRSVSVLWSAICAERTRLNNRPLRILDVACGGGDTVFSIARRAKQSGVELTIDGCDISEQALRYAHQNPANVNPRQHKFIQADVIADDVPEGYDIVMSSLFLHHLTEQDAVILLKNMASKCEHCVLVDDLRRTLSGYMLAWAGCRLLSRSKIVHFDGPQSVRAAFTPSEVLRLTEQACMRPIELKRHWPQRFLLRWGKT